jgi:hypothetical protein
VQRTLTHFAASVADPKVVEPTFNAAFTLEDLEDLESLPPKESDYAKWWGPWVGKDEAFYSGGRV